MYKKQLVHTQLMKAYDVKMSWNRVVNKPTTYMSLHHFTFIEPNMYLRIYVCM